MRALWHFRLFAPGDNLSDPEFTKALFSGEAETSLARSVVRESIQNSLDAKRENSQRVEVHFTLLTGPRSVAAADAGRFMEGVWDHLHSDGSGLQSSPRPSDSVPCLVVEDFGTHGLRGDPGHWQPTGIDRNSFFLFFRALGRSGKANEDRGRWGVGKFVFPMAGRGHLTWGLTVPSDGLAPVLMGRVVLLTHDVGGHSYHPDGHWGVRLPESGNLVLPERDPAVIGEFRRVFRLRRSTENGLSVVVPWVVEEINAEGIRNATLSEYFLPLLRDELVVTIHADGQSVQLDGEAVRAEAERTSDKVLQARLRLAIHIVSSGSPITEWPQRFTYDDIGWQRDAVSGDILEGVREVLEEGRPLSARVFTTVRRKGESLPQPTFLDFHVQRLEGIGMVRPLVIREGITLAEERTRYLTDHVALVIADHGAFATLIGDAETPAHEALKPDLIKGKYVYPKKALTLAREGAFNLVRLLTESDRADDPLLLASFFPLISDIEPGRMAERTRPHRAGPEPEPVPTIASSPPRFRVSRIEGGFRVRGNPEIEMAPEEITVLTAYDVRRGSPFKRYRKYDFDLSRSPMRVRTEGCDTVTADGNRLVVRPGSLEFVAEVTGFDPQRDLIVRVTAA